MSLSPCASLLLLLTSLCPGVVAVRVHELPDTIRSDVPLPVAVPFALPNESVSQSPLVYREHRGARSERFKFDLMLTNFSDDVFAELFARLQPGDQRAEEVPKRNKLVLLTIEVFGLGCLGIDRMYLGGALNVAFGLMKLSTCGGCGVWALIDFICIMQNALYKNHKLDVLLMNAEFDSGIGEAYVVGLCGTGLMSACLFAWILSVVLAQRQKCSTSGSDQSV